MRWLEPSDEMISVRIVLHESHLRPCTGLLNRIDSSILDGMHGDRIAEKPVSAFGKPKTCAMNWWLIIRSVEYLMAARRW